MSDFIKLFKKKNFFNTTTRTNNFKHYICYIRLQTKKDTTTRKINDIIQKTTCLIKTDLLL